MSDETRYALHSWIHGCPRLEHCIILDEAKRWPWHYFQSTLEPGDATGMRTVEMSIWQFIEGSNHLQRNVKGHKMACVWTGGKHHVQCCVDGGRKANGVLVSEGVRGKEPQMFGLTGLHE